MSAVQKVLAVAGVLGIAAGVVRAQEGSADGAARLPLRVLYLGSSAESATSQVPVDQRARRFQSFADFLSARFVEAEAIDRDQFHLGDEQHFDVVLLDWSQQDIDLMKMAELRSPLGPREAWSTPTVLLGSAGLLIAGPWELPGSWG